VTENGCLMVSSIHVVSSGNDMKSCVGNLVKNSSTNGKKIKV